MRIIDLSVPTKERGEPMKVEITYDTHEEGAKWLSHYFGCNITDFPRGLGGAIETLKLTSHAGTHVDSPWHYGPISEGKKARTIDEMPLEWFFNDGVVLDMRHKPNGSVVTVEDLEKSLGKIGYTIKPLDIILIHTGADKYFGKEQYHEMGCGLIRDSTLWLLEQGVKVIGTDAWSLDRPFWAIKDEFQRTQRKEILWEAHFAGVDKEYCHIEKLANLNMLPRPFGFKFACFPVKLARASAGWCRAVAIFDE